MSEVAKYDIQRKNTGMSINQLCNMRKKRAHPYCVPFLSFLISSDSTTGKKY
jgi:hypothetical protein